MWYVSWFCLFQQLFTNKGNCINFSQINHRLLAIKSLDWCNKCCKIYTVPLTYRSLQVLPWNKNTIIEKIKGFNTCCQKTDLMQYIHSWNQGVIIIINYGISLLQLLLCKNSKFKRMRDCNCSFIIEIGSFTKWVAAGRIAN